MPKTLTEAKLTTREARRKLPAGVHWRSLDPEVHLGYRKAKRGGTWVVRWRKPKTKERPCPGYKQSPLGVADDEVREGTLDFNAATKAARAKVQVERQSARAEAEGPLLTVARAVSAYTAERDRRDSARKGREVRSDAASRLGRYVTGIPARGRCNEVPAALLADVALHELEESDLLSWRASLPSTLRTATKQRLVNDLKAALNEAYKANRKRLPVELPATVEHGLRTLEVADEPDAVARDNQILTVAQVGRLISAAREVDGEQGWDGDFFRMVIVLASTGARFSQAARLRVGDVQDGRIVMPASWKGRKNQNRAPAVVAIHADVAEALLPAITGRPKDAPLLERWRSRQVPGTIRWQRAGRGPWQSSSELNRAWAAVRDRAEMPGVLMYAFRHSSIVRGIEKNLPIQHVAKLHNTSVATIEKHYGRWITDGLYELAARSVVPLIPPVGNNVVALTR